MPVAGNVVRDEWFYMDAAGAPLTGMISPTDVNLVLRRDVGAGFAAAPEAVAWTELGGGYYQVSFTPNSGGFYRLYLKELKDTSDGRKWTFPFEVVSAGSTFLPSFANAFCSEGDVESWAGFSFESSSKPTSDQVAGFAQGRASEMRSLLAAEGWVVGPGTVTPGGPEEDMLRVCNAIGAAADAWLSKFMDTDPAETKKATDLLDEYSTRLARLQEYAKKVSGTAHLIRTPMTSGEVTLADETPIQDVGLRDAIRMDQEW